MSTTTPTICTMVATRNIASSLPYAEENQVKFIHAQLTAKIANA